MYDRVFVWLSSIYLSSYLVLSLNDTAIHGSFVRYFQESSQKTFPFLCKEVKVREEEEEGRRERKRGDKYLDAIFVCLVLIPSTCIM